ncbi:MAG: MBL fold metallo-hydrolase [Pseudomonadota bacterium]
MGFASLGSGSRGNGTLVALAEQIFLVDCGFTVKQVDQRLARLGLRGGDLSAIFVTHEHSDHVGGVVALAHKYSLPIYASFGTARAALEGVRCHTFDGDVSFTVHGVQVNPVRVPHDAREPTQFVFSDGLETIGVLSDLGCVTNHVVAQYRDCSHLLLEANHDRAMLMQGSYPPRLKRRVGENYGHLSNEQAADLLARIAHPELHVVIGHVSEQNNSDSCLDKCFAPLRASVKSLITATQQEGFAWQGRMPLTRQTSFAELSAGEAGAGVM